MGLYDNYKQANSSYVSQFVGSIVPEATQFTQTMKGRFDEAQEQDDVLFEAMGNMAHLQDEGDTTYANEVKTDYANRMMERVKRGDYENMGRRTKRDARGFVADYKPLAQRLQAFQAIQQRVMDDDKIFSPETKNKILGKITHMNKTRKNPDGSLIRGADGKVALSAIQDWAYAKDVDVDKKLAEFLKENEAKLVQQGFRPDGQGLMVSATREVRTKEDLMRMAMERMALDPEIKAMIKRDAVLDTYQIPDSQIVNVARQNSLPRYAQLKSQGLTDSQINQLAKNSGVDVATLKQDPYKLWAERNGVSPDSPAAARGFVEFMQGENLKAPHADLVAKLLEVDKTTLDARADPVFEAKLKHEYDKKLVDYTAAKENAESISQYIMEDNMETTDYTSLHNNYTKMNTDFMEGRKITKSKLGTLLGDKPTAGNKDVNRKAMQDWDNRMEKVLNNREAQGDLLRSVKDPNTKNQLQALFATHNSVANSVNRAKQSLNAVPNSVGDEALNSAWEEYQRDVRDSKTTLGKVVDFFRPKQRVFKNKEEMRKVIDSELKSNGDIERGMLWDQGSKQSFFGSYSKVTSDYLAKMDKGVKESSRNNRKQVRVYEPYGSGYVNDMTKMVTNLATGNPQSFTTASGATLQESIEKAFKDTGMEDTEKKEFMRNLRVRYTDELSPNGNAQFAITLPNGATQRFETSSISAAKSAEMATRVLQSTAHTLTSGEKAVQQENSLRNLAMNSLVYTDYAMLDNSPKNAIVDINDEFAFKIVTPGNGMSTRTAGKLLSKDVNGKYREIGGETNNISVSKLISILGGNEYKKNLAPQ